MKNGFPGGSDGKAKKNYMEMLQMKEVTSMCDVRIGQIRTWLTNLANFKHLTHFSVVS